MDKVWEAIGQLTYAEMIELAEALRDAADSSDYPFPSDRGEIADLIECARVTYVEQD